MINKILVGVIIALLLLGGFLKYQVASLQGEVGSLKADIASLTSDNDKLTSSNDNLTLEIKKRDYKLEVIAAQRAKDSERIQQTVSANRELTRQMELYKSRQDVVFQKPELVERMEKKAWNDFFHGDVK